MKQFLSQIVCLFTAGFCSISSIIALLVEKDLEKAMLFSFLCVTVSAVGLFLSKHFKKLELQRIKVQRTSVEELYGRK